MKGPKIVVVTPALATANNGNWQTAQRWARFLSPHYRVQVADAWQRGDEAVMIALHARRSAASIAAWRLTDPRRPLVVVLTGTDLYRDIAVDGAARQSLDMADRLVVLNELGPTQLAAPWLFKASVCLQSSPARKSLPKTTRHLRALMVGHLREEKSPGTYFEAARILASRRDVLLDHIGAALEPALGDDARELAGRCPGYRWLGALPHRETRARIQASHVLVHASRMEGGAQVVIEAVTSGTPVIASRIDGNMGLLGSNYQGYFAWGDAGGLAGLLRRARDDAGFLPTLRAHCAERAVLFEPERERQALLALLRPLLQPD